MRLLSLLVAFQQALWIDLPFVQQDKNGCGSAAIWMVMEYWKAGTAASVGDIQDQLFSKEAGGIYTRDMARYFEARGYRVFTFHGEWADLQQHISKGRPLIVCIERNSRGVPLHYVVVAGVDPVQNLVLVNDPAQRKLLSMSRDEFERAWRATENWTLLALPEVDLASAAFRDEKLSEAREHLQSALRADPGNSYASDFLATVHFLENNNEAAIKYWNRAGKPVVDEIHIDPPLEMDPILLDRAFTFSRGSVLQLSEFETTQARLNALRVFSRYRFELSPRDDERFDLTFRAAERNGVNFLSWIRGLPFQTVQPSFTNIRGRALNIGSLLRWDSNKQRATAFVETPLRGDPKWSVRFSVDGRRENWIHPQADFQMQKIEASGQIQAVPSGRLTLLSGATVSHRRFSNAFLGGSELKYFGSVTRTLLQDSPRELRVEALFAFEAGKLFSVDPQRFAKVRTDLSFRWRALSSQLRLGRAIGRLPFDENFVLGLERDSDLWVRGHTATVEGRKTAANAGRAYFITNSEFQKKLVDTGWFGVNAGPFVDSAKSQVFSGWVVDAGIEMRFHVLHAFDFALSYGKGLRDHHHALFLSAPM